MGLFPSFAEKRCFAKECAYLFTLVGDQNELARALQ